MTTVAYFPGWHTVAWLLRTSSENHCLKCGFRAINSVFSVIIAESCGLDGFPSSSRKQLFFFQEMQLCFSNQSNFSVLWIHFSDSHTLYIAAHPNEEENYVCS